MYFIVCVSMLRQLLLHSLTGVNLGQFNSHQVSQVIFVVKVIEAISCQFKSILSIKVLVLSSISKYLCKNPPCARCKTNTGSWSLPNSNHTSGVDIWIKQKWMCDRISFLTSEKTVMPCYLRYKSKGNQPVNIRD